MYTDPTGHVRVFGEDVRAKEILISIVHPIAASKVWDNRKEAFAISNALSDNLGGGAHNGTTDAFRHAYFNALNTKDIGESKAKQFGDAHESNPKQPDVERNMDLHNNAVGRDIATNNPKASNRDLIGLIIEALVNGELINSCDPKADLDATYTYGSGVEQTDDANDEKTPGGDDKEES